MTDLTPQQTSPLAEATPTSLEDLFNKDPLLLTQQDLEQTVQYLRKARETFLRDDAAGKTPSSRKKAPAAGPKVAMDDKLTVADLDLEL